MWVNEWQTVKLYKCSHLLLIHFTWLTSIRENSLEIWSFVDLLWYSMDYLFQTILKCLQVGFHAGKVKHYGMFWRIIGSNVYMICSKCDEKNTKQWYAP